MPSQSFEISDMYFGSSYSGTGWYGSSVLEKTITGLNLPDTAVNIKAAMTFNSTNYQETHNLNINGVEYTYDYNASGCTITGFEPPAIGDTSKTYQIYYKYNKYDHSFTHSTKYLTDVVITISWDISTTACTAPTSVTLSAPLAEGTATLRWSGQRGGTNNAITGYDIQYSDSDDNSTWGSWKTLGSTNVGVVTYSVSPPSTRGSYRRFRVRTKGAAGSAWYSGWMVSTGSLRKNILPTTPGSPAASPALHQDGAITITWTRSTDSTSSLSGYRVQYRERSSKTASWGAWETAGTTTNLTYSHTPSLAMGAQIQYRIHAYDNLGAYSSAAATGVVTQNTNPTVPTNLTCSVAVWQSGSVRLSWGASSDVDGNLENYIVSVKTSANGSSYELAAEYVAAGTSYTFTPPSGLSAGAYIKAEVRARDSLGLASDAASVVFRRNNVPGNPSGISLSPALFETSELNLSWTAGTASLAGGITYEVQGATKPSGGSWSNWIAISTVSGTSLSRSPSISRGTSVKYRVRAVDALGAASSWVESGEAMRNPRLSAPAGVASDLSVFESGALAISWTAPSDPLEILDHYYVEYATITDGVPGTAVSIGTASGTSISASVSASRGQEVVIRVYAVDTFGVLSDPGTVTVRRNSLPVAPRTVAVDCGAVFENVPVTINWSLGSDPDGNLIGYQLFRQISETNAFSDISNADFVRSVSVNSYSDSTDVPRGRYVRWGVCSIDRFGQVSTIRASAAVRRNRLPSVPTIIYPAADGMETLSTDPVFGVAADVDPDDTMQIIQAKITSGGSTILDWTEVYRRNSTAASRGFRCGVSLSAGDYNIELRSADSLGAVSEAVSRTFTIPSNSPFSRTISSGDVISDLSTSHQADIRNLVSVVNARRAWFGLGSASINDARIGYFADWLPQMQALARALNECAALAGESIAIPEPHQEYYNYPVAATFTAVQNDAKLF